MTGIDLNRYRLTSTFCPALMIAIMLGGCGKNEKSEPPPILATPTHPLEIPLVEKPAPTPQPPAAPLRRALNDFAPLQSSLSLALNSTDLPFVAFQFSRDAGQTNLRARFASNAADPATPHVATELEALGFKRIDDQSWSRSVSPEERAAFEQLAWARLSDAGKALAEFTALATRALLPGQPVSLPRHEHSLPGKLVYTGNPLDLAFADSVTFLAVDNPTSDAAGSNSKIEYVRGGRLFVDSTSRLRIESFALPGAWKEVPPNTRQLNIKADGRVLAINSEGANTELGQLEIRRVDGNAPVFPPTLPAATDEMRSPLRTGHLEFANLDSLATPALQARAAKRVLETLLSALAQPTPSAPAPAGGNAAAPAALSTLTLHADLPWTEKHLKALGITVERTPGLTTIAAGKDPSATTAALEKVLQVLRLRMSIHEQNLRNAERVRDADNRINPYRRKIIEIGPQGEAVEKADPSPLQKISKPGDPNADAEGFVTMPNVNRAVETSEFQAAADEYRLIRTAMERLAPQHIFPDPIPLPPPPKPEAP